MKINLKHIFPEVTCEGSISIDGNKIKYKLPNSFYNGELDIENLQYAYLIVKPESQAPHSPVLALSAPYLYRIPVNFKGFKEAYELLSARYDFDNDAFFRHLKSNEKIRKQIWRRVHETNFTIIHDNNFSDIDKGFTILSPEKDFIQWDDTYAKVANNSNAILVQSEDKQPQIKFKFPVQVGNIIINDVSLNLNKVSMNTPIIHLYAPAYYKHERDKSYFQLKEALTTMFGPSQYFYERSDQNYFRKDNMGIEFSLSYTYDSNDFFETGYTSFNIKNAREYPQLLLDPQYEQHGVIDDYIILTGDMSINSQYRTNERIKNSITKVKKLFNKKPAVWIDHLNNKIGFTAQQFSMIFGKDEIKNITIQNLLPAKGPGGSYLRVLLANNNELEIFNGDVRAFNPFIEQLKTLTAKEIVMKPEYPDE